MSYILLDGKATSAAVKDRIAEEVRVRASKGEKIPHLAAILIGEDGASATYVANKEKACDYVGFKSTVIRLPEQTTQKELLYKVDELNGNPDVDGIIVQLPLPRHIDSQAIIAAISPEKDVDGFHPQSTGKMMLSLPTFIPATPLGIITLLKEYKINTAGMHCVVIGRSNIVGRPVANLLSSKGNPGDCTVTICHSKTPDIKKFTIDADIVIAALGSPNFVKADMIKEGAIVIDVGITRIADKTKARGYRLCGDVDFDNVAPKCSYITPVPGGVGPMTVASLLENTLIACKLHERAIS